MLIGLTWNLNEKLVLEFRRKATEDASFAWVEERRIMPAPTMTPEQRQAALEKARIVRTQRSELTKKIQMGVKKPAEVLDEVSDPIVGRMKVKSFINAVPGYGKVKAEKLMAELGIQESRRLQGLGSRQMQGLKEALS